MRPKSPWRLFANWTHSPFLALLLLAFILRAYRYTEIPFTADELSALFRWRVDSLSELIQFGVVPDFHPAGVQWFLWMYSRLIGEAEAWIKLPFLLCGLASLWLCYHIGRKFYGKWAALFGVGLMSVSQFFILYSQLARPYAPALFFSLLAFCGLLYLLHQVKMRRGLLLWTIGTALTAYTHYYALLYLVCLALVAFPFLKVRVKLYFALASLFALLVFLPHWSIFTGQLAKGGVESWLAPPESDFLLQFGFYLFHYSWLFVLPACILMAIALFQGRREWKSPARLVPVLGFFLAYGIGHWYSIERSAILQFSGLLFATPALLLALFSGLKLKPYFAYTALATLLLLGMSSLVLERKHYQLLYHSPFEEFVGHWAEERDADALGVFVQEAHLFRHYANVEGLELNFDQIKLGQDLDLDSTLSWLRSKSARSIHLGLMFYADHRLLYSLLEDYKVVQRHDYYQGTYFVLSKLEGGQDTEPELEFLGSAEQSESLTPQNPFGLGITLKKAPKQLDEQDRLVYRVEAGDSLPRSLTLALSVEDGDSLLLWRGQDAVPAMGKRQYLDVSIGKKYYSNGQTIQFYAWQRGLDSLYIERADLYRFRGNPYLYGLYYPF